MKELWKDFIKWEFGTTKFKCILVIYGIHPKGMIGEFIHYRTDFGIDFRCN